MGMRPARSAASRDGVTLGQHHGWPKWASVAAVGRPT